MPKLDWMFDPKFSNRIAEKIYEKIDDAKMSCDKSVVTRLVNIFEKNRERRYRQEIKIKETKQRDEIYALASVEVIVAAAIVIARENKRDIVEEKDLITAYRKLFCKVWPFC